MSSIKTCGLYSLIAISIFFISHQTAQAQQVVNIQAADAIPKTELSFSPSSGTFTQGSTFEVPLYINTKGSSVGALELHMSFDPNVLSVVKPSGGSSVIGLWIEAPSYDNTKGTITFIGGVPRGITTSSGLIAVITFEAKNVGSGSLSILNSSRILLNDGVGSPAIFEANRGQYTVVPPAPGSVVIFSETHPFHDHWYNNNTPVFTWKQDAGVSGYSTVLDNKPNTVPDNTIDVTSPIQTYESMGDGTWYFHVKALKGNIWGATTHYEIKIDTEPPADFTPQINYITAAVINRALVSFFTTDALSGIDHYEVGVIDKSKPATESPAFFRSESPYQVPFDTIENARLIVRAFDRAGNVRDASIDVHTPLLFAKFLSDHAVTILIILLIIIILLGVLHYFYGHHILRHAKAIWKVISNKKELEKIENESDQQNNSSNSLGQQ